MSVTNEEVITSADHPLLKAVLRLREETIPVPEGFDLKESSGYAFDIFISGKQIESFQLAVMFGLLNFAHGLEAATDLVSSRAMMQAHFLDVRCERCLSNLAKLIIGLQEFQP